MKPHSAFPPEHRFCLNSKRQKFSGIISILKFNLTSSGFRYFISLLAIFLITNHEISAQIVYTSVSSGLWNSPTTWDRGAVPGTGDDAVISANHIVSLMNDEVIRNLKISAEGVLNADNKEIRVNGNLYCDGVYTSKNSAA